MTTLQGNGLHLLYTSSVELQIDRVIVQMFELIQAHGIRRVVVDAIGDLAKASADIHRTHDYLYALVQQFTVLGITALLLLEDVSHNPTSGGFPAGNEFLHLSYMCDNLMLLEIERGDVLTRRFSIFKTRGSVHDETVHPVTITAEGVRVG